MISSRSSKHHKSSSKKHSSSSSKSSKSKTKPDDWTDITEPEERRRIQNRIAQRKFREKNKEHREKSERDIHNQEHAGRTYHVPEPQEITDDGGNVSGLPWGGVNMRYVVARGHENESRRGSGKGHSQSDPLVRNDASGGQCYAHVGGGIGGDYNYQQYDQSASHYNYGAGSGDYFTEDNTASSFYYPDFDNNDTAGGRGT